MQWMRFISHFGIGSCRIHKFRLLCYGGCGIDCYSSGDTLTDFMSTVKEKVHPI